MSKELYTSPSDLKREQRRAAIEEKRKKLAQVKEKNLSIQSKALSTPSPSKKLDYGKTWDDIIETIESLPSTPQPSISSPLPSSTEHKDENTVTIPKKPKQVLTICLNVSHIDVFPKVEPTYYSKGVQTNFIDKNEEEEDIIMENNTYVENILQESSEVVNNEITEESEEIPIKDIDIHFIDEVDKEKVFVREEFQSFLSNTSKIVHRALHISEKYDIFKDNRIDTSTTISPTISQTGLSKVMTLSDDNYVKNFKISSLDWSPFDKSTVLSSLYDGNNTSTLIEWDMEYDGAILNRLTHTSRITSVKYWQNNDTIYNSSRGGSRIIVGGSYTGQVVLWDSKSPRRSPIEVISKIENNSGGVSPHHHPIYSIDIIDNHHFVTIDTSGHMSVWDINNMKHPLEQTSLIWVKGINISSDLRSSTPMSPGDISSTLNREVSVSCCSFKDENTYYVGSEDGIVYQGQRHGEQKGLLKQFLGHRATISSVKVHPQQLKTPQKGSSNYNNIDDLLLSSSLDWTVSLWSPKLSSSPLLTLSCFSDYVTDIAWSKFHPALFAVSDSTGKLSIFNLNAEEKEMPILVNDDSKMALQNVLWSPHDPNILVAGSHSGYINIYNADINVTTPSNDEWSKLDKVVEDLLIKSQQTEARKYFENFDLRSSFEQSIRGI